MQSTQAQPFGAPCFAKLFHDAFDNLPFFAAVDPNPSEPHLAYTEIDQSVSAGFDLHGQRWHRQDDKLGAALVSSGLSEDHREYLQLGGSGFLLGDGNLSYGRETIAETYYTAKLWGGIHVSFDVQRVWNPGYNRARGPVLVSAVRLHLEGALFPR